MLVEDAPCADCVRASLTKILDLFLKMPRATSEHGATWSLLIAYELRVSVLLIRQLHDLDQLLVLEKLL